MIYINTSIIIIIIIITINHRNHHDGIMMIMIVQSLVTLLSYFMTLLGTLASVQEDKVTSKSPHLQLS